MLNIHKLIKIDCKIDWLSINQSIKIDWLIDRIDCRLLMGLWFHIMEHYHPHCTTVARHWTWSAVVFITVFLDGDEYCLCYCHISVILAAWTNVPAYVLTFLLGLPGHMWTRKGIYCYVVLTVRNTQRLWKLMFVSNNLLMITMCDDDSNIWSN